MDCEWGERKLFKLSQNMAINKATISLKCIGSQPRRRGDKILGGLAEQLTQQKRKKKLIQRQPIVTDAARSQESERKMELIPWFIVKLNDPVINCGLI